MTENIKFSVATNFDGGLIEALRGYPVAELFGKLPSDKMGGGRASFMLAPTGVDEFKRHVRQAAENGIGFNYLLNAACLDNSEYTRAGRRELYRVLDFIKECGIGSVTISLPSLLPAIKKYAPGLKVRIGVYARVDSVAKARFWEDSGADSIALESISVNRDFRLLENIRKAVGLELQLLVNSNCLMFCPLSGQHMVNLSHASQKGHISRGFFIDYCALKCSYEKLREPVNYLRSEFIRPEDLRLYTDMGYTSFKVLERGAPTEVMAMRVKAYSEGRFEGNLLDLIQPYGYKSGNKEGKLAAGLKFWKFFFRPRTVKLTGLMKLKKLAERRGMLAPLDGDPVYLDNRALDGFLDGFRGRNCRSTDCNECGWCASFTKKAVRVEAEYRTEMLAMYDDCFREMDSGMLWGLG